MEIGGVRVIERQDNSKMLYVIASTKNKHPIHQRTVAHNKAYRDLLAYFDGREIDAQKKLDRKKTTIITDDGVSHKIVKSLDEKIITCVRGKARGMPTVGTWRSADKNIFYIVIVVVYPHPHNHTKNIMKTTTRLIAKATALILLATAIAAPAQQAETVEITAEGYGASPQEAEKDALRAAVKRAVGTFVDSETLIDKEEVVKDQILTHSDGFVEKVIDAGKAEQVNDSIWKVTKKVLVRKSKLVAKLKEGGVVTASIAGEDIWAQEISKIQNVNDGRALLRKFLQENTMNKLLVARHVDAQGRTNDQAKPEIKTDHDTGKTTVTFRIQVYYDLEAYYNQYIPKLIKLLDQIMVVANESYPVDYEQAEMKVNRASSRKAMQNPIADGQFFGMSKGYSQQVSTRFTLRDDQKNLIFVNIGRDKAGQNMRYKVYRLPEDGGEFYYKDLVEPWRPNYKQSWNMRSPEFSMPKLQLFVMGKNGEILRQNDFYGNGLEMPAGGLAHARLGNRGTKQLYLSTVEFNDHRDEIRGDDYRHFLFEPRFLIDGMSLRPSVVFVGISGELHFTDTLTYSYSIEMDVDDTKNLGSIQMRFP
ncbi:hypothetical protein N9268_03340 [Akkermansiaceae bacterium]|nr:hypothetical protein [Akkermansiaceae bacterium]MDB4421991.1 hypothetical protein [Akkermansiaceae bacterium]MDB4545662.1 hypothetical protein [Akkermansiaceae bacterium]